MIYVRVRVVGTNGFRPRERERERRRAGCAVLGCATRRQRVIIIRKHEVLFTLAVPPATSLHLVLRMPIIKHNICACACHNRKIVQIVRALFTQKRHKVCFEVETQEEED